VAKQKAIYEPGELDRVREKLGVLDPAEAKRLAGLLGGEVGVEKAQSPSPPPSRARTETVDLHVKGKSGGREQPGRRPKPRPSGESGEGTDSKLRPKKLDPSDDPATPVKLNYRERIKMDRLAGSAEFDIKSPSQVFHSMFFFFSKPVDLVSPVFVNKRMNEYYQHIELMVTVTRALLPRNSMQRNERFKRISPLAYGIVDLFRQWNIEKIAGDLAILQANPRNVKVEDFTEILRIIYKPLFLIEQLDLETHIKESYRLLYKILFIENPTEAIGKRQEQIRSAMAAFDIIRRDVRFLLYPLLLKLLSDKCLGYNAFFSERRNRLMAFLEVSEADRLPPKPLLAQEGEITEEMVVGSGQEDPAGDDGEEAAFNAEQKEARALYEAERKALDRGLDTLETLFPKAGWDRMAEYPDFFPYFSTIFDLGKNYALIPPTDPLQQVMILIRILEELLFGLRYVSFNTVIEADGTVENIEDSMTEIMTNWHFYYDEAFSKEYLPRLAEYCRILDSPAESRTSPYAKRLINEIHWTKRLYFLPYYRFESSAPPPFQKKDVNALYPEIRRLRKRLTAVAEGIEQGLKTGGPKDNTRCEGIENPWENYNFQVPNPVSNRLDVLLGKKRTNASLIFYTLAVTVVLDYLVNNDNSWAYDDDRPSILFRSVDNNGVTPAFGVDTKIDTDALFKQSLKRGKEQGEPAK
jgi:hypothetical protein